MDIHFEQKRILITGAARGIGAAIAKAFAENGGNVVATDINGQQLNQLAERIQLARGGQFLTKILDITNEQAINHFIAQDEANGAFDVFVHVAGGVLGQVHQPIEKVSIEDWDRIYAVNIRGAFMVARAIASSMKVKTSGKMVFISSGAGLGVSLTGIQAYASAKAALISLARQLGHELGPYGITVNTVAPGFLRTSPDYERQWASYGEEGQARLIEQIPLRRLGEAEDIAHAVMFLASPFACFINGQTLSVSGGL